ncbi:hypothetical protein [Stieleria maiorica]|nr:hypothetical protein [Stieleria maiorica]
MFAANAAEGPAQDRPPKPPTWRQFNQVFVKVIIPVTSHTPKQDGPVVESWVAEELRKLGETECFAVTDWVPVCDGLLEDDVVDNRVWDGGRFARTVYCPVGGDIPQRKEGRLLVNVRGWTPGGLEVNIALADEPGSRAVGSVQILVGKERKPMKTEEPIPYVAVIITPPPLEGVTSHGDVD